MIALLAPMGLAALAAAVFPLLIHLLRRPEERVVPFAAWRYLAEPARPRERLQLRHWLLLVLRVLLIVALAVLMSQAIWRHREQVGAVWTVLWPGVTASPGTLDADHRATALNADAPMSRLREIDADLPAGASLTVMVPTIMGGLDAERPRLSRSVQWQVTSEGEETPSGIATPLQVAIRARDTDAAQLATVHAVLDAWKSSGRTLAIDSASPDEALPRHTQVLFWLSGMPTPDVENWIASGGRALLSAQGGAVPATPLWSVRAMDSGRVVRLAGPLDATQVPALRDGRIPAQLAALLFPDPAVDRGYAQAVVPMVGAPAGSSPGQPLDLFVALIAALLFVAERWMATRLQRP